MSVKVVKLENFANELRDFTDKTLEQQKAAVASGIAKSIPDLVDASPVDTGLYAQSWAFSIDEEKAIIGNFAPHASIIEEGARPFTPPIGPLLAWAKRVLQDASQPPNYSERVRALAYGTQKKIAAEGIKPRHILRDMIPTIIQNIKEELNKV